MRWKNGGNVPPPHAQRDKKQRAEEDDVWRPEGCENPIGQSADGERSLCAKIVGNRYKNRREEGLNGRRLPPVPHSKLFQKGQASFHSVIRSADLTIYAGCHIADFN